MKRYQDDYTYQDCLPVVFELFDSKKRSWNQNLKLKRFANQQELIDASSMQAPSKRQVLDLQSNKFIEIDLETMAEQTKKNCNLKNKENIPPPLDKKCSEIKIKREQK